MKAKIPAASRVSKRQMAVLNEAADELVRKRERERIRRLFKLMCISLNETYGFGKRRLECVIGQISDLVEEHDRDEVYWAHVDRVVIDGLGVKFKREAEE